MAHDAQWVQWIAMSAGATSPRPHDGHLAFIESHDRARHPLRATRMKEALTLARLSALRSESLTFASMQSWQRIVLGTSDVEFRRGEAFAKNGLEHYGVLPEGWTRLRGLAAAGQRQRAQPVGRAVRAYLDACFFHSFDDGNGRAARLALDFVLAREGLALHMAEPVFGGATRQRLVGRVLAAGRGRVACVPDSDVGRPLGTPVTL